MTGARAIVEILKQEGITHVFGVPGESFTPLLDALYDETSIRFITTRHEGGASFMAEAYGKVTGTVGVVLGARAVGGANLSIGVHTARENSTPLVVLLGQVKSRFRGREGFQEVDLTRFFGDICKWAVEVHDVERIPEFVQRAFRVAKSGRPGPVVLSLPEDVLAQAADLRLRPASARPCPRPSQAEIAAFYQLLRDARRPLIIAGAGVNLADAESSLQRFAEKWQIPVIAAWRRHDVFPNNHPLYVGHLQMGTFSAIVDTVRQADTIIAIGTRFSEITTQGYALLSPAQKLIHIDIEYAMLGKVYAPDLGIVADANEALLALLADEELPKPANIDKQWVQERRRVYEQWTTIAEANNTASVDQKQIIRTMQQMLPADAIITNDAGNFAGWLHSFYQFKQKKTYVGAASGAMGYALPAALGAKLGRPDRTVVALAGDGGFMMTVQELETAVRYHIPVVSLIFNNNMYGSIRMHQEKAHPYRVIGSELGNPDFQRLGESFGVFSATVTADAQFADVFRAALDAQKPAIIEIVCDPEQISVQQTITSIRNASSKQE
ncbi:thiamine pyrophosphate-dependent enzyme [Brevibacillus marinus]|uniref:thiamine pyrophosphate-dependent enzyme n=1 Tax=Brevibacillus marinus TaxID=2496837 RepID=UPI000F83ED07|nr:thiamine pyrophosphate-dependent enzyme [Brevibacillus marinus]